MKRRMRILAGSVTSLPGIHGGRFTLSQAYDACIDYMAYRVTPFSTDLEDHCLLPAFSNSFASVDTISTDIERRAVPLRPRRVYI